MPDVRPLMVSDAQRKALQWLINNLLGLGFRGAGGIELVRSGKTWSIVNRGRRDGTFLPPEEPASNVLYANGTITGDTVISTGAGAAGVFALQPNIAVDSGTALRIRVHGTHNFPSSTNNNTIDFGCWITLGGRLVAGNNNNPGPLRVSNGVLSGYHFVLDTTVYLERLAEGANCKLMSQDTTTLDANLWVPNYTTGGLPFTPLLHSSVASSIATITGATTGSSTLQIHVNNNYSLGTMTLSSLIVTKI